MSSPSPIPPMPEGAASPKKGLHPMAWVGMGCGGLLVIAVLAIALVVGWGKRKFKEVQDSLVLGVEQTTAEMLIEMSPELELVSEDPTTGEITVAVNGTGEQLTFSPEEIAEGRVTFTGVDGTTMTLGEGELGDVPAWVPRLPTATDEKSLFHRESGPAMKGLLTYTCNETGDDVESFYDTEMSSFSSTGSSTFIIGDVEQKTLSYEEGKQELEVVMVRAAAGEPLEVTVTYRDGWAEGVEPNK